MSEDKTEGNDGFTIAFDTSKGVQVRIGAWLVTGGVVHYAWREENTGKTETICGIEGLTRKASKKVGDKGGARVFRVCDECADYEVEAVEGQVCEP